MSSTFDLLTRPVREPIRRWVLSAFPRADSGSLDYDQPHGDPGLFGPDSATWHVHSDFPGMLAGGLAALTLQTLHPLALAGVWDHSSFRDDLVGRLRRTTAFVGGTTYAPRAQTEALITHVRKIHDHISGHGEDGRPYSANDPDLLTWVHVSEAYCFLQGYRRYSHIAMPVGAADRYYREVRQIAEALGAQAVPASEREVAEYFRRIQPELAYTERSRVVLDLLGRVRLPVPAAGLSRDLFLLAGSALLPDWATTLLERPPQQQRRARLAAHALWSMAPIFRAALRDGIASRACRRMDIAPEQLHRWDRLPTQD
ncbi:oxygenase MpaB family protein [Rhodanobacter sp. AS-Z3]|uniref:oxygenase MpaB family protein n=1 Tax=Rhodanobacter sp. AS-Z3 TaxID=3031330 RepID=UPI00247AEB66|nr:oxygenase MpaB family protein [Rhodanobacter sp. AS-Z3]WEN16593.1 oxygenase MpaB family protein [Rhodanobacter sp. AS-Z3]